MATKTRRGPETSEVLKTFEDLSRRGVCLSVTTNSAGQGRAGQDRAGAGAGAGQGRAGQGRGRARQGRAAS